MKPAVAIVSKQRLVGATNGSSAYLLSIARSLVEAGFVVHLIQPSPTIFGRTPLLRVLSEMELFERHTIRASLRVGNVFIVLDPMVWLTAILGVGRKFLRRMGVSGSWTEDKPRPYSAATLWTIKDLDFVQRQLPVACALIIADYIFCVPAFERAPNGAATAIIMHDLFHARGGGTKDSVASVRKTDEIELLAKADVIFAIQEEERSFIEANVVGPTAILVPMPAVPCASAQPGIDDTVLFVGSNTAPNSVGLEWFLAEVWPLVLRIRPHCSLQVAGSVNRAFEGIDAPRVRFLGLVPDLSPLYRDAAVVISPLTFGSGLKIKLVEALAAGKAMVTTPTTLQGVIEFCSEAVVCTKDPATFAAAVADLASSREAREALAKRALASAERNFSAAKVHRDLRAWLTAMRGDESSAVDIVDPRAIC